MTQTLKKGEAIAYKDEEYLFESAINLSQILALNPRTGCKEILPLADIKSLEAEEAVRVENLDLISADKWAVAKRRYNAIRPMLARQRNPQFYEDVAKDFKVDKSTIYRWRKRFIKTGLLSSLLPERPGVKKGTRRVPSDVEAILKKAIDDVYLKNNQATIESIYEGIILSCRAVGLTPPHKNTLRGRIAAISENERKKARSRSKNIYREDTYNEDSLIARFPLHIVQIDHTKLDITAVDDISRMPIGRPWITIAIDVFSRTVPGFVVTLDPPGALSVGLCLHRCILQKKQWLTKIDVDFDWPVWGLPTTVHADNAKEFRGKMLEKACEQYGIDTVWRPVAKPNWGGHIERLMLTKADEMKKLPGATFSNPNERADYDSDATAAMTLKEIERYMAIFIAGKYHNRVHTTLGRTPLSMWQDGLIGEKGIGLPRSVPDEEQLFMSLLPYEERTINEYGVQIDNVRYFHDVLRPYINSVRPGKYRIRRNFMFRRDPRDISRIYFWDEESGGYFPIPYRDSSRPAVSLWELKEALRYQKRQGISEVDENTLFSAIIKLRELVATSQKETKQIRRDAQRRRLHDNIQRNSAQGSTVEVPVIPPVVPVVKHDLYDGIEF